MSYRFSELGIHVKTKPKEARAVILAAFERACGEEARAAGLLGVSARSLRRWVVALGLKPRVSRMWRAEQARRKEASAG